MIDNNFSQRKPKIIDEDSYQKYAVLVPIIKTDQGLCFLFEERAKTLMRQPGEICFPGGKLEENETSLECAIRETVEELMITQEQIEIIGPGDIFISPYNTIIYPYLGKIYQYDDTFSIEEVESVIKVPLEYFINNEPQQFKSKLINNLPEDFPYEWIPHGKNYPWSTGSNSILFYHYNEKIIWGFTARIVKSIVDLIKEYNLLSLIEKTN